MEKLRPKKRTGLSQITPLGSGQAGFLQSFILSWMAHRCLSSTLWDPVASSINGGGASHVPPLQGGLRLSDVHAAEHFGQVYSRRSLRRLPLALLCHPWPVQPAPQRALPVPIPSCACVPRFAPQLLRKPTVIKCFQGEAELIPCNYP